MPVSHLYTDVGADTTYTITITLLDDDAGVDIGTLTVQVLNVNPIIIIPPNAVTPSPPEAVQMDFIEAAAAQGTLDQTTGFLAGFQTPNFRVGSGFIGVTTERYLMLVVIAPDGSEIESHRISDDVLFDLRDLFATLPDGRYKIYLVRTDNNTKRLVIEVFVRRGRVIDPNDVSEGTRDRPPTSEAPIEVVPLEENPLLERIPDPERFEEVTVPDGQSAVEPQTGDDAYTPSAAALRWAAPVAGLALAAGRASWSQRLDAAFECANERSWQRLRRSGRTARWLGRGTRRTGRDAGVK
jgi:hypothetical protein